MAISVATYEQIVLEDEDRTWELVCGRLREKPPMTSAHNSLGRWLHSTIQRQLPFSEYEVGQESVRVALPNGSHYVPDLAVVPRAYVVARLKDRGLETFSEPLPLIVEVWSKSTGDYDVDEKLTDYQRRGDLEIWRIHPYEKTLVSSVLQLDGSYMMRTLTSGTIVCAALPAVIVNVDEMFSMV